MHDPWQRLTLAALVSLFLTACNSTPKCSGDEEYLKAIEKPRLDLPANVTASERMAPLVIPPVAPDTEVLDPAPNCLDEPPPYASGRRAARAAEPASGGG
jgi:uncharacterized lipoprotein